MSEIAIRTEKLSRDFGSIKAVDGLSMEVPGGIIFGFLGPNASGKTTTVAGIGILISLRSATVQAAQQLLMTILLIPPLVLGVIFTVFHKQIGNALEGVDFMQAVLIAMGVLITADVVLLLAIMARFQRARLIQG